MRRPAAIGGPIAPLIACTIPFISFVTGVNLVDGEEKRKVGLARGRRRVDAGDFVRLRKCPPDGSEDVVSVGSESRSPIGVQT